MDSLHSCFCDLLGWWLDKEGRQWCYEMIDVCALALNRYMWLVREEVEGD